LPLLEILFDSHYQIGLWAGLGKAFSIDVWVSVKVI